MRKKDPNGNNRKDKRKELLEGVALLYFVVCMFIVAVAQQHKWLTYGQLSLLFLPLLIGFIFFEIHQYHDPYSPRRPSRQRTIVSCTLVGIMIALTILYNLGNLLK